MRGHRQCLLCGPSAVAMRSREPGAVQQRDGECAASPASAAAMGGVRRLRDELNAALLDQQQQHLAFVQRHTRGEVDITPSTSTRKTIRQSAWEIHSTSSPVQEKTPAWSDLDSALRSLTFQSCATALGRAKDDTYVLRAKADCTILRARHGRQTKHTARIYRVSVPDQVVECARRGKRHPHAEPAAREEISRRYLTLWRSLARTTVIARQLSRRATSHHRDLLARHAFHAWQLHWCSQQYLHRVCGVVASRSNIVLLGAAYRRWRHAFRLERVYRALQTSRRRRLLRTVIVDWQARARFRRRQSQLRCLSQERTSRAAWKYWRQFISHRHQQVSRNTVAQAHFLRRQWKKLVRQVQYRIERRQVIKHHIQKRWRRTREVYFDGWIEFIDWKAREQLGMKWYHERLLETVFANWKAAHDRVRYIQILEKRAHKKVCRHRLRRCLHQWVRAVRYIAQRAVRLKVRGCRAFEWAGSSGYNKLTSSFRCISKSRLGFSSGGRSENFISSGWSCLSVSNICRRGNSVVRCTPGSNALVNREKLRCEGRLLLETTQPSSSGHLDGIRGAWRTSEAPGRVKSLRVELNERCEEPGAHSKQRLQISADTDRSQRCYSSALSPAA